MASINFLYRSTKDEAPLNIRLLYRINDETLPKGYRDIVIGSKIKLNITREYWDNTYAKNSRDIKDVNDRNIYIEVNEKLTKIETHVLNSFNNVDTESINKDWLNSVIDDYYQPKKEEPLKRIPKDLVSYIDFYIDYKSNELNRKDISRINVTKHKLERFQKKRDSAVFIMDINDDFKKHFQIYLLFNEQIIKRRKCKGFKIF